MEVRIARLDVCPTPSKVVGFTITHVATGKSLYLDAFVDLEDIGQNASEHDVAKMAWEQVKPNATHWISELDKKNTSIVGSLLDF